MRSLLATVFACLTVISATSFAQPEDDQPAKVELLANVSSIKPGEPFTVGVRFTMKPHWHVYWLNPGDSGMPPEVKWKLPEGFTVSELQFPVPKKFEQAGNMVGYGYEDDVLLTATITPPTELKQGPQVSISADVNWMVCQDLCQLGDATLSMTLPVGNQVTPANQDIFKTWRARMPKAADEVGAKVSIDSDRQRGEISIIIDWSDRAPLRAEWFPPPGSELDWTGIKVISEGKRTIVVTKSRLLAGKVPPDTPIDSLLAYDAADGTRRAVVAPFLYPRQTVKLGWNQSP